ncbi:hypothetical protein [Algibacter sp. L4_22]|uniref:hypothetical protein n=1 Tax=Algibacter sp. L4_22 TaxID=2942477 RepID=UPI00201B4878|nr:hypothetical protein [Algibacter sp. L4_22]MCL5129432.1 hypothetical protein [Algibacter sp. L4_22]
MYKREIEDLQSSIESSRKAIKATRENMARQRANKSPKHYQESGKRNIEYQKKLIEDYKKKIANYREKKKKGMGKGVDSFKRELGKNTGKWVSNKVFGDGHSTPHRVDVNRTGKNTNSFSTEGLLNKGKELFAEDKNEIAEEKREIEKFDSKKEEVIEIIIPNNADEIMNVVNLMLSNIKLNGWKAGNEEHINSFSDVCLTKLEQCAIKLKSINEVHQAEYVETEINKLKKKRKFQKYALWVGIAFALFVGFILSKLGIIK